MNGKSAVRVTGHGLSGHTHLNILWFGISGAYCWKTEQVHWAAVFWHCKQGPWQILLVCSCVGNVESKATSSGDDR